MADSSIQTRAEFLDVLARTLADAEARLAEAPDFPPYRSIAGQLAHIKAWTENGRTPTEEERGKVSLGLIAIRELDPEPESDEEADYIDRLHLINGYLRRWPDDPPGGAEA